MFKKENATKEFIYEKEMQKYAKEAFSLLCEMLEIRKSIQAMILPKS